MADSYLNSMREVRQSIEGSSDFLRYLAKAFYTTGNPIVADKLEEEAERLNQAIKLLRRTIDSELNRQLDEARKGSAAALEFGLAYAAKHGKEEQD